MKITNLLILSLILVVYNGCYYGFVYPDDNEFHKVCKKAYKEDTLGRYFYEDTLKNMSITYHSPRDTSYLGYFEIPKVSKADYIFGKDKKENNIYKVTINADKVTIESLKAELLLESNKNRIDKLQKQIFVLQNYYLEYTEQRIDKKTLITKVEYVLKNKKTHNIALRGIDYFLYADRYKSLPEDKIWQPYDMQYPARGSCVL
ncbi:hypothetical protein [Helicobacter trogontum]|uniref:Uncharacterized protein n=1 Tax=Helicobacter trogontum TaxID=50960 RepID=A0A4V6I1Z4_9HELI|nr:hypothetical protein [Helicobacter trogontum]MDY5186232.1 hypothetical protein [Helicobacter trogontum]TLD94262.1 hypothetical protein LS80_010290 [Helicobacter trogontum]